MKVTSLAITPPPAAQNIPKVTPELLASCLARYSRSNKGIDSVLAGINWADLDKSVDAIFRFVDYGHASIAGLTGGIAMTVDGCSMWLAYKLFEIAQLSDGQESSTRYIQMNKESLPTSEELGIPKSLASEWQKTMEEAFEVYDSLYQELDKEAELRPEVIRFAPGTPEKVITRLRKNYALDRARYLIPFATRNNIGLVMTARVWAHTIRHLDALELPEARRCAELLRAELERFAPRLIRHSFRDDASVAQAKQEVEYQRAVIAKGVPTSQSSDKVFVKVDSETPDFLPDPQKLEEGFAAKKNRYSTTGVAARRPMVRFAWNNIAIAELRDLNRHRTGMRFTPLTPVGFYLPREVDRSKAEAVIQKQAKLVEKIASETANGSHIYGYLLGIQTPFEHSTHLDKLIYEIELRTGLGAHYRYAEHLAAVAEELIKQRPEYKEFIEIGTAEPE